MIVGHVRDHLPRVTLSLPGREGEISVEFVLDTGFDGDLTLPGSLLSRLDADFSQERVIRLADGSQRRQPFYEITLDWNGEPRIVEITQLESDPLLGALLLEGLLLQAEMIDGGEVLLDTL